MGSFCARKQVGSDGHWQVKSTERGTGGTPAISSRYSHWWRPISFSLPSYVAVAGFTRQVHSRSQAAIKVEDRAGHKLGRIRHQICCQGSDLFRLANTPPRNRCIAAFASITLVTREITRHLDCAGRDDVGPNVHREQFYCQFAGETIDRAFGASVDGMTRTAQRGMGGRHIYDGAPRPGSVRLGLGQGAPPLQHMRYRPLGAEKLTADIQIVAGVVLLLRHFKEICDGSDPGVVHQRIESAQKSGGFIDNPSAIGYLRQVALDGDGPPSEGLDFFNSSQRAVGIVPVMNRHIRAQLPQHPCNPMPNASTRTSD